MDVAPALASACAGTPRPARTCGLILRKKQRLSAGCPARRSSTSIAYEGTLRLVIEDLDLDEVRAPDLRAQREAAHDGEVAQRELAHDAAHDDEREEHPEQQVEEVVRRC